MTPTTLAGRIWLFGADVDTDAIIPARYLSLRDPAAMVPHLMEPIRPGFAARVAPGDIIVAGKNFGCGSSREQAVRVLQAAGIAAVVAESFGRIFFRNAINNGYMVLECPGISGRVTEGERVTIDVAGGRVQLPSDEKLACTALPPFLMQILAAGGLVPYLKARAGQ